MNHPTLGAHVHGLANELSDSISAFAPATTKSRPPEILILTSDVKFSYRVLRCAAEAGCRVHILGTRAARALASSRFCASFTDCNVELAVGNEAAIRLEIDRACRDLPIGCILPSNQITTEIISAIRPDLAAPAFPLPKLETFHELNDKWRFMQLCETLGVPYPKSRLMSRETIAAMLRSGEIRTPQIAKPTNMFGKVGVVKIDPAQPEQALADIFYEPVLLQDYIEGGDICTSLFCRAGEVLAEVSYTRRRGLFSFVRNEQLSRHARAIAKHFDYDGVLAFDARLSPDGRQISFIECNPRFWYDMDIAMIGGLNFVSIGLRLSALPESATPSSIVGAAPNARGVLLRALTPWRLRGSDFRALRYHLSDPPMLMKFILTPRPRHGANTPRN